MRTVACFGQCALAPVVEVNHAHLRPRERAALQREVEHARAGRASDDAHPGHRRLQRRARSRAWRSCCPRVPRIAVGMGTCGTGNGAEGVYHAFAEAIEPAGRDIELAPRRLLRLLRRRSRWSTCGCPGKPLVVLRRVQASDVGRILDDLAAGNAAAGPRATARSKSGTTSPATCATARAIPKIPPGTRFRSSRRRRRSCCATAA